MEPELKKLVDNLKVDQSPPKHCQQACIHILDTVDDLTEAEALWVMCAAIKVYVWEKMKGVNPFEILSACAKVLLKPPSGGRK